jgi:hypothetical protein
MRPSSETRRRGIKLVVVIVVLAVVIVVGLVVVGGVAFMGYSRVKESAGRIACINNMRAIGTGMSNYASSSLAFPLGNDPKNNTTLFWKIREQVDVGNVNENQAVAIYLCPSRRSASSVAAGKAPADYGWSKDSNSILGSSDPVRLGSLTVLPDKVILLGHTGIRPQDYNGSSGDDGPWKSNGKAFARTPAPLYPDDKVPNSTEFMGSPHRTGVPHLYADGSVKLIDYDVSTKQAELLTQLWQYNRKAPLEDLGK